MSINKKNVIDLFCGCGGLSYGFIEAGYNVVLGIDHWKDAIITFENNHNYKEFLNRYNITLIDFSVSLIK